MVTLYAAIVHDASHLGGPMGTEYTTVHRRKVFSTAESATVWLEKFARQANYKRPLPKRLGFYVDVGPWCLELRPLNVEGIG